MCCKGRSKVGLVLCSVFLLLISLGMIGGGSVCVAGKSVYGDQLQFLREELKNAANDMGAASLDETKLDILFITRPCGIVLIVFGAFIMLISILGFIAACCSFHTFQVVFCVMLGFLLLAQTVVTICAYIDRTPFDSIVKEMLKESLLEWTGIDGEDGNSLGWNAIMSYFRCCGVDNFSDAAASPVWTKNLSSMDVSADLVTPLICCTIKSDAPNCAKSTGNAYLTQTYFNRGCYQPMWDYITSHTPLVITVVFLIFLFEFLCLFFAVWNICSWKSKEGTSQVNAAYHTDDYHNADYRNDPYRNAGPRSSDYRNTDYRTKDHRIDDYRKADYRSADNRHDNYRNGDYRTEDYRNADYRQKDHGRYPN